MKTGGYLLVSPPQAPCGSASLQASPPHIESQLSVQGGASTATRRTKLCLGRQSSGLPSRRPPESRNPGPRGACRAPRLPSGPSQCPAAPSQRAPRPSHQSPTEAVATARSAGDTLRGRHHHGVRLAGLRLGRLSSSPPSVPWTSW